MHALSRTHTLAAAAVALAMSSPCHASTASRAFLFQKRLPAFEAKSERPSGYKSPGRRVSIHVLRGRVIENCILNSDKSGIERMLKSTLGMSSDDWRGYISGQMDALSKASGTLDAGQRRQLVLGMALGMAGEMRAAARSPGGAAFVDSAFSQMEKCVPEFSGLLAEVKKWVLSAEGPETLAGRLAGAE